MNRWYLVERSTLPVLWSLHLFSITWRFSPSADHFPLFSITWWLYCATFSLFALCFHTPIGFGRFDCAGHIFSSRPPMSRARFSIRTVATTESLTLSGYQILSSC